MADMDVLSLSAGYQHAIAVAAPRGQGGAAHAHTPAAAVVTAQAGDVGGDWWRPKEGSVKGVCVFDLDGTVLGCRDVRCAYPGDSRP